MNAKEFKELLSRAITEITVPEDYKRYSDELDSYYTKNWGPDVVDKENKEWREDYERFEWANFIRDEGLLSFEEEWFKSQGVTLSYKDQFGGEGQGEEYWIVFEVDHNGTVTHFKLDGWYQSYHGYEFEDMFDFYEVSLQPVVHQEWVTV